MISRGKKNQASTMVDDTVSKNTLDQEQPKDFIDEEKSLNTVEDNKGKDVPVVLTKQLEENLNSNKKIFEKPKKEESGSDLGGLSGNDGQQQRYNHFMDNKQGEVSKYFWSGRK